MPCFGATVVALSHCTNGITCWDIPISSTFNFIKFHALFGDRNGAAISGCTREMGAIDIRGTVTLYGLGVAAGNLDVPSGIRDNTTYIYSSRVTSTSLGTSHSGIINTEAGSWTSWMSLEKARTFPYSDVGLTKDRVTNWVPQSTLLFGSGESRNTSNSGL